MRHLLQVIADTLKKKSENVFVFQNIQNIPSIFNSFPTKIFLADKGPPPP